MKPATLRPDRSKRPLRLVRENPTAENEGRPRTRGECRGAERPCPWVSCRHSLYPRERVRQIEEGAIRKMARTGAMMALREGR